MDQLIAAFRSLHARGKTDEQLYRMAADANQVAGLLAQDSIGSYYSMASSLVSSGCSECAVTMAISEDEVVTYEISPH